MDARSDVVVCRGPRHQPARYMDPFLPNEVRQQSAAGCRLGALAIRPMLTLVTTKRWCSTTNGRSRPPMGHVRHTGNTPWR